MSRATEGAEIETSITRRALECRQVYFVAADSLRAPLNFISSCGYPKSGTHRGAYSLLRNYTSFAAIPSAWALERSESQENVTTVDPLSEVTEELGKGMDKMTMWLTGLSPLLKDGQWISGLRGPLVSQLEALASIAKISQTVLVIGGELETKTQLLW